MKTSLVLCCDDCSKPFDKNETVYKLYVDNTYIYLCQKCINKLKNYIIRELKKYYISSNTKMSFTMNGHELFFISTSQTLYCGNFLDDKDIRIVHVVYKDTKISTLILDNNDKDDHNMMISVFSSGIIDDVFSKVTLDESASDPYTKSSNDVCNNNQSYI